MSANESFQEYKRTNEKNGRYYGYLANFKPKEDGTCFAQVVRAVEFGYGDFKPFGAVAASGKVFGSVDEAKAWAFSELNRKCKAAQKKFNLN